MAKGSTEEGPQPPKGYFSSQEEQSKFQSSYGQLGPSDTRPNNRYVYKEDEFPKEQVENPETPKKVPFAKQAIFFLGLVVLTYTYWFFGQLSIGIPDEYIATIFTVLLYNWFVKNDYQLPKWLKK